MDKFPLMTTKLRLVFTITIAFLSFYGSAQSDYWKEKVSANSLGKNFSERFDIDKGQQFSFDEQLFKKELTKISVAKKNSTTVYFPNEDGKMTAFQVSETPVLAPELSLKFPNIKSYAGYSVEDRTAKVRFSVSHKGIQSMMVNAENKGATFMQKDSGNDYVLYTRDPNSSRDADFICATKSVVEENVGGLTQRVVDDQVLRKFRLAVSASGEYTQFHGGTVADALAAINATITRINQVFETDLSITLELVAGLDQVIFTDAATDPYDGNLNSQTQNTLDNTLGSANYDIGILLNQAGQSDGNAGFIGSVCIDGRKGSCYATGQNPEGDLFDIDFVSHEMGHQLGANHTWSFESEGTMVQVEPASGTTIMGYAGIVGVNNVASNGDDYFHYVSIVQMTDYIKSTNCAEIISLTNVPPVITPVGNYIIPKSTAFVLSADATDADVADVLTYSWEQIDNGVVPQSAFGPTNPLGANFKSQKPVTSPQRYFPKLSSVINGQLTQTNPTSGTAWETVSDVERELNFSLTVRDNALGGGQVVSDLVNVFVDNSAGPFGVTSFDTSVVTTAGSVETITWDVANTNMPPINTQTVDLLLSIDGGLTFPISLAENVPNDGSHNVVIPGSPTVEARIMVKANGNIFFAVNAADFTIETSEIVLNFEMIEQEVCQSDVLVVPFTYETYEGFIEEATFSIATPPVGVDIAIFPETAINNNTAVEITFTNTQNLDIGSYPIRVIATTASISKEVTIDLNVIDANFTDPTLVSPANGLVDAPANMLLEWEANFLATSYDIEVATDVGFTAIVETATVLGNAYAPVSLENQTQYFWRVKPKNSCGEGVFGSAFNFTTIEFSCINIDGEGLPLNISTTLVQTLTTELTIFDDLAISDINVNMELDHTYLADLTVTLTSPAGTTVVLFNNSCNDFRNVSATFDDNGQAFECNVVAPAIQGIVKPLGLLSSFNGESTLGKWVLTVTDNAPADGGVLKSFSLDVCAEGEFRPDDDADGVFDDGPDLCLGTPPGMQVDASGCPILIFLSTNFTLETQSESCRSSNDGSVNIRVKEDVDYTISIVGNGINETDTFVAPSYTISNLMAGTYTICMNATDGTTDYREQCFEVVITEPEILSVSSKANLDGSFVDLELQGASLYNIELNGVVTQTEASQFTLSLKDGTNTLKVSSNLACQGVYEEQFFYSTEPIIYPNPFTDLVRISFGANVGNIWVKIFSANGRFIANKSYPVNGVELELDLSTLATGLYFIKFEGENVKGTSKVIKK